MNNNIVDLSNFIIIIWWAFQWKSLISLKLASRLKYSWVISTDYIRNFLRLCNKSLFLNISTSEMDEKIFERQRKEISDLLYSYVKFYSDRKEKIILEWMHFSRDILQFFIEKWAKCFWLNNQISWLEKVKLKAITTPTIKIIEDGVEKIIEYSDFIDQKKIFYIQKQEYYKKFQNVLMNDLNEIGIQIINYNNIEEWFKKILNSLYN